MKRRRAPRRAPARAAGRVLRAAAPAGGGRRDARRVPVGRRRAREPRGAGAGGARAARVGGPRRRRQRACATRSRWARARLLATAVGDDRAGERLVDLLKELGADPAGVVRVEGRPTTRKTRVEARSQQMVRFDRETDAPLPEEAVRRLQRAIDGGAPPGGRRDPRGLRQGTADARPWCGAAMRRFAGGRRAGDRRPEGPPRGLPRRRPREAEPARGGGSSPASRCARATSSRRRWRGCAASSAAAPSS